MAHGPAITLFGYPFSHWCVKAEKLLRYKGLAYESRRVGYHDKRELLAATGQDYVPALVLQSECERTVVTYAEIPDALERLVPEPTIYPGESRGICRVIEDWAHARLEELAWRVAVPAMPPTFEDDVERWVFEEWQTLKRGPLDRLAQRRPEFEAELAEPCSMIEEMLVDGGFLLGNRPSLADFAVFGALFPIRFAGLELPLRFTRLTGWYERLARI